VKPKTKMFGLFRRFEPISKQPKQKELFWNKPKQPNILWKIPKYALFQTVWVGLLFVLVIQNIETLYFGTEAKQLKQTVSKQTEKIEKTEKTLNFQKKIPKYAPYQTVLVGLLFVSVQSKHQNSIKTSFEGQPTCKCYSAYILVHLICDHLYFCNHMHWGEPCPGLMFRRAMNTMFE
jgi:hypothetical protein